MSKQLDPVVLYAAQKALSAKERHKADTYCGDNESFPLYKDGSHLAAAWDLAGHSPNPQATRDCILRFAREHGLMDHLPLSARQHGIVRKAQVEEDEVIEKILGHPLTDPDPDAIISEAIPVQKAWSLPGGEVVVEGWISTEDRDIQNEVTTVEAFLPVLPQYAALGMPLTTEHQMLPNARVPLRYPVGHVQKAAAIRDGQVLLSVDHPTDSANFEHFPGHGTGVWGRAVITDPLAASQVLRGNVRGFSWTGKASEYEPLPGGGRKFTRLSHLQETTVAAFPINTKAAITAVAPQG